MIAPVRVLLVEDEALVVMMLQDILEEAGYAVVGPAGNVAAGRLLVSGCSPDAALLDVNLRGQRVYPVAVDLQEAGIPFGFITGYGIAGLDPDWRDRPTLQKPFRAEDVLRLLHGLHPSA